MALVPAPDPSPRSPPVFDPSSIFSPSSQTFPLAKVYTPIPIRKHATYTPCKADQITTIQASWGPMTMHGSYYLVEESGTGTPRVYGSTVEAWRETNRLVEGEVEGRGVWIKVGVVRAVQVADSYNTSEASGANEMVGKVKFSDPRGAAERVARVNSDDDVLDNNQEPAAALTVAQSPLLPVPVAGMVVLTYHNGNVETERILQEGDWMVRQEGSAQKEVMVLSDTNFRARYTEVREVDE